MATITGTISGILEKKTKKGKNYRIVKIEDFQDGLFDWDFKSRDFEEGNNVSINYEEGRFPRLDSIAHSEQPATQKSLDKPTKSQFYIADAPKNSNRANSIHYLAMKLATELVAGESIQVDEKIKRLKQTYDAIREEFETAEKV